VDAVDDPRLTIANITVAAPPITSRADSSVGR